MGFGDGAGGGGARARWRRRPLVLAAAAGCLAVLVGAGFWSGLITVYDGPGNAGVVVGWDCHNAGLEVRGASGFFFDECG